MTSARTGPPARAQDRADRISLHGRPCQSRRGGYGLGRPGHLRGQPRVQATSSDSTLTVPLSAQTYQITSDQWYPSGDQSSPLVYQRSVTVPDLCGGGKISLAKGGIFTATLG